MYSHINVFLVSRNTVTIHFNDGAQYEVKIKGFFDFSEKREVGYSKVYPGELPKTSVTITEKDMLVVHEDNNLRVFFPGEMQYQINKDFIKGQIFDLNYRKHLRAWYSRDLMTKVILPQANPKENSLIELTPHEWEDFILEAHTEGRKYSEGRDNKPIVIISPNGVGSIMFTIVKNEQIVLTKHFFD